MTRAVELAQRDAAIRQAKIEGASIDDLAAAHGLGRRQVQRIVSGTRTSPRRAPTVGELAAVAADPVAELESVLRVHTDVLTELEDLCRSTKHDGVRLGALRARADLATQRFAIFRNVPVLREEQQARELLSRFLLVMDQHTTRLPSEFVADLSTVVDTFEPTRSPLQEAA
jgi:hypothetical protein